MLGVETELTMTKLSKFDEERIAYHEAGHGAAAVLLGQPVGRARRPGLSLGGPPARLPRVAGEVTMGAGEVGGAGRRHGRGRGARRRG
jgi:hypothetical protein